jgi:putative membrane protein
VNRQAQAAVLFLMGVAVLRASSTDLYLRYVKAGLRPLLLVAGIVLIAAAVATVWYELKAARAGREEQRDGRCGDGEHGHGQDVDGQDADGQLGHGHREPRVSWLLVLPLLALILVAPPAPGSYSAMRAGTALKPLPDFPALPSSGTLRLDVGDYAGRAVFDHGRRLGDRRIKMTGFVALDRGGAPYLTRMVLNCCAADAQPIKVRLSGELPPTLQPDTWLEVTGTYTRKRMKDPVNDGVIPFFEVGRARPVKAPPDEYEG